MTTRSVTLWGVSDPKTCLKCGKLDSFFYLQSRDTHLTKANLRTSHGKTAGGVGGLLGALQIPGYLLNAVNIFGTHWQTTQWPFRLPASATETMSIHKRVIKHGVPPKWMKWDHWEWVYGNWFFQHPDSWTDNDITEGVFSCIWPSTLGTLPLRKWICQFLTKWYWNQTVSYIPIFFGN